MTKKKKSILSDQRFIVLLVIIALSAVFSIMSKEFRQYTTLLSMLDFSYYDLLMAIGVTFPLITGGVDLSIGTGMVCYALIAGTMVRSHGWPVAAAMLLCLVLGTPRWSTEWCSDRYHEPAAIPCNSLYLYDHPWCRFSLQRNTVAGTYPGRWMVPYNLQDYCWYRKKCFSLSNWFPVDGTSGYPDGIRSEPYKIRTLYYRNRI